MARRVQTPRSPTMRPTTILSILGSALLATACVDFGSTSQREDVPSPDEECECKIEGAAIGQVGAYVHIGDERYVFEEWYPKADSPGEYVGFRLSPNSTAANYLVKTGTTTYAGSGVEWTHPNGATGSDANAISNVDFCEDYPDGPGDDEPTEEPPGDDPGDDLPEVD